MQARIARVEDVTVIYLSGRVDVETAEPFREACLSHLANKKVVFDFKSLSFVGSSGILPFLETMQSYATGNAGLFNFSGVGTEFRRVFAATPLHGIAIFDTHLQAVEELMRPKPVSLAAQLAPLIEHSVPVSHGVGVTVMPNQTAGNAAGATVGTEPREFLSSRFQVDGED